ncbi:MAG: hypothetical protein QHH12_07960 [Candidatus Bathyarchaeota archaeon]|nr:hypothetical protein [Candidatus Bathyarchaeota archaeon A05DMB-3]MDH7607670.1 hypothetical protein [Candidatus Bathyarchaeota archaeon]
MRKTAHNAQDIVCVFEECWKQFVKDYDAKRLLNVYCSEADTQLHFASLLLKKLQFPPTCVYVEFPIPFNVEDFIFDRLSLGRPIRKMKKGSGIIADIVVMGAHDIVPFIIAEIKYSPLIWNYLPIFQAIDGKLSVGRREKIRNELRSTINRLKKWEAYGPSINLILGYLKNMDKIIGLIREFKDISEVPVHYYLCIIEEIYPNLKKLLQEEIKKHNPPDELKLLFHFNPMRSWLEEQLNKMCRE